MTMSKSNGRWPGGAFNGWTAWSRSGAYERVLNDARETAVAELTDKAAALGGNAVIGVDIDYETVGQNGSMLMVTAAGTAVVVE